MKKSIASFLLILAPYTFLAQNKVKVHVTYTNSYCGGARPTPEIELAAKTPRNLHDVHLVIKGKKHFKIVTDSTGSFKLPLKPGKYKVFMSYHKNDAHETNYDPSCKKMMQMPFGELEVIKGVLAYETNLHFPCSPCEQAKP